MNAYSRLHLCGRLAASALVMCVLSVAAAAAQGAGNKPLVVDGFDQAGMVSALGQKWETYTDGFMGGKSEVDASVVQDGANKVLRLAVTFGPGYAFPFAGIQTFLDKGGQPRNLEGYSGVEFRVKGNHPVTIQLLTAVVTDYNEFSAEAKSTAEWSTVKLPFTRFAQSPFWGKQVKFDAKGIRGIRVQVQGIPAAPPAEIEIDDIRFY